MDEKEIKICLQQVIRECKNLGIPISDKIESNIEVNKRAKSRFASCKRNKVHYRETFIIEISEALLGAEDKTIKEILFHELLHTCPNCYNHGVKWKQHANKINLYYGYNIKATATYEELGLKKPDIKKKINYVILCEKCGNRFYRQRKSKIITNTDLYRCKCGGKLICYKAER